MRSPGFAILDRTARSLQTGARDPVPLHHHADGQTQGWASLRRWISLEPPPRRQSIEGFHGAPEVSLDDLRATRAQRLEIVHRSIEAVGTAGQARVVER